MTTTTQTDTRDLATVASDYRFAMLVTADQTARPLTLQEVEGDVLRFLVSSEADWTPHADGQAVLLSLADPKGNSFASITGIAQVQDNRAIIARLYNGAADAFFDGKDDPTLRLLEVRATSGEWWDGPSGRLGQALGVARAKVTGNGDNAGDQGTIALP